MKTRVIRITRTVELVGSVLVEVPHSLTLAELEDAMNDEASAFEYLDDGPLAVCELARDPKFIGGLGGEFSYDELTPLEVEEANDARKVDVLLCPVTKGVPEGDWREALVFDELMPATETP